MKVIMTDEEIISAVKGLSIRSLIDLLALINFQEAQCEYVSPQEVRLGRAIKNMNMKALVGTKEVINHEISTRGRINANPPVRPAPARPTIGEDSPPPPPPRRIARLQDPAPPPDVSFTLEDRQMLRSVCERLDKVDFFRPPPRRRAASITD